MSKAPAGRRGPSKGRRLMAHDPSTFLSEFCPSPGRHARLYSLPRLEAEGLGRISRLPVCLRIVLESLLRNLDGQRVREQDLRALAAWKPNEPREAEVPFVVARVLLQDFTGVP